MKFKTTIEMVTDANDKHEALDIVGEYLSGYLTSGVNMKCSTKRFNAYAKPVITVVALSLMLAITVCSVASIRPTKSFSATSAGTCAIQPPLKTSSQTDKQSFKKTWEKTQVAEALKTITQ